MIAIEFVRRAPLRRRVFDVFGEWPAVVGGFVFRPIFRGTGRRKTTGNNCRRSDSRFSVARHDGGFSGPARTTLRGFPTSGAHTLCRRRRRRHRRRHSFSGRPSSVQLVTVPVPARRRHRRRHLHRPSPPHTQQIDHRPPVAAVSMFFTVTSTFVWRVTAYPACTRPRYRGRQNPGRYDARVFGG